MLYQALIKPVLFRFDAERVHSAVTLAGETLGPAVGFLAYQNPKLEQKIDGISFPNPIGLAAGFDYDGHLARTAKYVGFGFNTVGTVTAKPYGGNPGLRLGRLPKSKSLFVNKGFKSEGVAAVARRLDHMDLKGHTVGVSIGSSNLPEINTISKAITDYCFSFEYLKNRKYISYFELNISCPNLKIPGVFTNPKNLEKLLRAIKITKPVYIKMPNEISFEESDKLVALALKHGISGFVFSNLVKDRKSKFLDQQELSKFANLPGNFSGRPTYDNSNKLIAHTRNKFGKNFTIIGCGGIFSTEDAQVKFAAGANLVQLITGVVFEGPQLIGRINRNLANYAI